MIALGDAPDILVIGVARIGDTLMLTPGLRALKAAFPRGRLSVLAHPKRRAILENFPAIDTLGGITKHSARLKGWWPGKTYDVAVVYGREPALVQYALRVARRVVCFAEPALAGLRTDRLTRVALPTQSIHAVDERLLLIDALLGAKRPHDRRLGLALAPTETDWARQWYAANGVDRRPRIGLQTLSFPTKAHRDWPLEHFAQLIDGLRAAYPEACFVVLGDHLAAVQAEALGRRFPGAVVSAAGKVDLRQSAALMSLLDLYVGVDTGPTHIAGALGIPMVALYHHRYPGRNLAPQNHPHCVMIEHPATGHADGQGDMRDIAVAPVLAAARTLLGATGHV